MSFVSLVSSIQWDWYFIIALVITIYSHVPRIIEGKRVFSKPGKFWTRTTILFHLITILFFILAYISWKN